MEKQEIQNLIEKTKPLTVLYVEDDENIAIQTKKILAKFFGHIIYAIDGQDGLNKFIETHIDIIISDINMPNLDGIGMLQKIRLHDPKVPAIFVTAHNEIDYYKNAINLHVKGYLLKPVAIHNLLELLKEIIEEKELNDSKNKKFEFLQKANKKLLDIGYKLSSEKNYDKILETILLGAKNLSHADGGTLYLYDRQHETLDFKIAINDSLQMHVGGTSEKNISLPPLSLFDENNRANRKNVAVVCAVDDKLININDIYHSTTYDFTGAKSFDEKNNYKTTSMLVIPMRDRDNELVGVIQLVNKLDDENKITSFNRDDESLISSMSSQATMTLQNNHLVIELENLLYSLVKSIGSALGEKSAYTARHVDNVASVTELIAKGVHENETTFKDISFSDQELEEIKLAAWLHDIGKITTPEYVVDKATRLETIYDRLNEVEAKFEILKRDIEIEFLKNKIDEKTKDEKIKQIEDDIEFLHTVNSGDVFMSDDHLERVKQIASRGEITIHNSKRDLLTENELYNLSILKGTLTDEEREVINNHVVVSYKMLKEVPFPKKFSKVAKLAGSHHKKVSGGGYAHEDILDANMTVAEKILAVADIFEALSSHDRPYRGPNTLNQIARILMFMVQDKHLDKDIVRTFLEDKLYEPFVKENFLPDQIDEITINFDDIKYR